MNSLKVMETPYKWDEEGQAMLPDVQQFKEDLEEFVRSHEITSCSVTYRQLKRDYVAYIVYNN